MVIIIMTLRIQKKNKYTHITKIMPHPSEVKDEVLLKQITTTLITICTIKPCAEEQLIADRFAFLHNHCVLFRLIRIVMAT